MRWAEVEGAEPIEFAYLEDGPADGPLALCLHGFPDHAPTWSALLGDLAAAGFHAVAPWMRGYAPTAVPADGLYQTGALSLDAIALADALGPADQPAMLIGHDWGAMCAYGAVGAPAGAVPAARGHVGAAPGDAGGRGCSPRRRS